MVACIPHPEEANHRFSCSCLSQEIMQLGQAIFISFTLARTEVVLDFEVKEPRFETQIQHY